MWYPLWLLIFLLFAASNLGLQKTVYASSLLGLPGPALFSAFTSAFFMTSMLALLTEAFGRWCCARLKLWLASISLLLAIVYISNLVIYAIMGLPLDTACGMLFTGRLSDLVVSIRAVQIPVQDIGKLALAFTVLLAVIPLTVRFLERLCRRRPLGLRAQRLALALGLAALPALVIDQFVGQRIKAPLLFEKEQRVFVWTPVFFRAQPEILSYRVRMKAYQRPDLPARPPQIDLSRVPENVNVFYFVTETLRGDFVNSEIMPELAAFQNENTRFALSRANANVTHLSWHAMYLADYPTHWPSYRFQENARGSLPLQLFRAAGFKVRLYSSKLDLDFWDSRRRYYGENRELLDEVGRSDEEGYTPTDGERIAALLSDVKKMGRRGRNLYVVNLDAAHHHYTWPADFAARFQPFVDHFDYLKFNYSPLEVDRLRNRYKNSLHYVDSLLGIFFKELRESGLYRDAHIAVVGDHGEEFMEHQSLIHGSNLFNPQTEIGLALKIPGLKKGVLGGVMSQIHVLPTLLDGVGAYDEAALAHLPGRSVLGAQRGRAQALIVATAGVQVASRYALVTEAGKLFFQLDERAPLLSEKLIVTELFDNRDQKIAFSDAAAMAQVVERDFLGPLADCGLFESLSK